MKVSILMPSRGRAAIARRSVDSLRSAYNSHDDYEVLVYLDQDDPQFSDYKLTGCKVTAGNRHGYANLHEYYNLLAQKAKGDWLMLWNDDAFMETPDWVSIIAKEDHTIPQVLNVWNEQDNLFPLISRAWYEAVGHFSRNAHADSWVQQTADIDRRSHFVQGISIKHQGEDLNDETHIQVRDVVRQTSEAYRRMGEQRLEDARKISEWVREHETNK